MTSCHIVAVALGISSDSTYKSGAILACNKDDNPEAVWKYIDQSKSNARLLTEPRFLYGIVSSTLSRQ
jgi:hypothetical protein